MRNLFLLAIYIVKYLLLAVVSLGFLFFISILTLGCFFIKADEIRFEIERMNRILKSIIEV